MSHLQYKNLPTGFIYPLTKKELREFIAKTGIEFEKVVFSGLSSSEHYYSKKTPTATHYVMYLDGSRNDLDWSFRLEIKGLKIEKFGSHREEIAQALLLQIENWIIGKQTLAQLASETVSQAMLAFNLQEKNLAILKNKH